MTAAPLPLSGIRVLDLSTLLPGPLATLLLAEAGAEVVKIERPGLGDEMRSYSPKLGEASANYAVLNRGKRAFAMDLKDPTDVARVLAAAADADIVVEQFRPGVADRLGIGYASVRAVNPDVIYCSISGYGPDGPSSKRAGHDLTYLAESGLLGVVRGADGAPVLPPTVIADIAGGTYPALVNILLALRVRDQQGEGAHLHISMAHNLQMLAYGYFASHQGGAGWPKPGAELLTGGSPRYHVYATADGGHVAVAALEAKFWERFTELLDLPLDAREDAGREREVIAHVSAILGAETTAHWREVFAREDVCVSVVATYTEAVEAGLMDTDSPHRLAYGVDEVGALPLPLDPGVRRPPATRGYPVLERTEDPASTMWAS